MEKNDDDIDKPTGEEGGDTSVGSEPGDGTVVAGELIVAAVDGGGTALGTLRSPQVQEYIQAARAPRTRHEYRADLRRFMRWGGAVPAAPEGVADYLVAHAATHTMATLGRWLVSIGYAHTLQALPNPCKSELVKTTFQGIRRRHGRPQRQVAPALRDDLLKLVGDVGVAAGAPLRDIRDRALLLIGFAGAFRRSELVALTHADLAFSEAGVKITIRRAKTDQEGQGRTIGIPYARGALCPVRALERWLAALAAAPAVRPRRRGGRTEQAEAAAQENHTAAVGRDEGVGPGGPRVSAPPTPIFRPLNRHGQVAEKALTGHAVAVIVKARCLAAGIDPAPYSGHSLRAGFCTQAALANKPNWQIRKQSGHKTDVMLNRYIRDARIFSDNPLEGLL